MNTVFKTVLDLNRTVRFCDELPLVRPMAGRTPNTLILEDLPSVRRMGNRLQQGIAFLTHPIGG